MTNTDITGLLAQLETHESKVSTVLDMFDSGFDAQLVRAALEELYVSAESLKLGVSAHEEPYRSANQ